MCNISLTSQISLVQQLLTYGPFYKKSDSSRTTSYKTMYKSTDSQDLKLKMGDLSECVIEIITL